MLVLWFRYIKWLICIFDPKPETLVSHPKTSMNTNPFRVSLVLRSPTYDQNMSCKALNPLVGFPRETRCHFHFNRKIKVSYFLVFVFSSSLMLLDRFQLHLNLWLLWCPLSWDYHIHIFWTDQSVSYKAVLIQTNCTKIDIEIDSRKDGGA